MRAKFKLPWDKTATSDDEEPQEWKQAWTAWRVSNDCLRHNMTYRNMAYSFWTMHFDTNPPTLQQLNQRLRSDPRVLRWEFQLYVSPKWAFDLNLVTRFTFLKKGETLPTILETSRRQERTLKYNANKTYIWNASVFSRNWWHKQYYSDRVRYW